MEILLDWKVLQFFILRKPGSVFVSSSVFTQNARSTLQLSALNWQKIIILWKLSIAYSQNVGKINVGIKTAINGIQIC